MDLSWCVDFVLVLGTKTPSLQVLLLLGISGQLLQLNMFIYSLEKLSGASACFPLCQFSLVRLSREDRLGRDFHQRGSGLPVIR